MQAANEKLLLVEANELLQQSEETSAGKLISAVFTDRTMQEIAKLSAVITEQNENAITYFVTQNEDNLQCVCACGKNVTANMNTILKSALPFIKGKGGGNPKSARGGGKAIITSKEFLTHLVHLLKETV